jgi:hypothetical protein
MQDAVSAEYRSAAADARAALAASGGERKRTLGRLRRELRRIARRDYFSSPERENTVAAIEALADEVERLAA